MRKKRKKPEEGGPNVPAYIVTFSDMVTLLLTFFVLLISLATIQSTELFHRGQESFIRAIKGFGVGLLLGERPRPDFGHFKVKHYIIEPETEHQGRTINADEERVRKLFKKVDQSMETLPSQIVTKETNFTVTNIRFSDGEATLNGPTKEFLGKFAFDLQQNPNPRSIKLYVLGLAGDESSEKKQWTVSARRAGAVASFLRENINSEARFPIYWWGAGPGGDWVERNSPISQKSQIMIAVLGGG